MRLPASTLESGREAAPPAEADEEDEAAALEAGGGRSATAEASAASSAPRAMVEWMKVVWRVRRARREAARSRSVTVAPDESSAV